MSLNNLSMSAYDLMLLTDDKGGETDTDSTASFIGIIVAISGNILISLALNCQKLAHRKLERERRSHALNGTGTRQSLGGHARSFNTGRRNNNTNLETTNADDDEDVDERTRVGGSSLHHTPNSDDESSYGGAIPFPVTGIRTKSPTYGGRSFRDGAHSPLLETDPLLVDSSRMATPNNPVRGGYGTEARSPRASSKADHGSWRERAARSRSAPHLLTRVLSGGQRKKKAANADLEAFAMPVDVHVNGEDGGCPTPSDQRSVPKIKFAEPEVHEENETDYLKSKLWWLGFLLMGVGESGNFISYGFAPASVVAPLGTVALIANCFFAPLMLKERFRRRDILGILLAIAGAITVVLSASSSDRRLSPEGLIHAITQRAFITLAVLYAAGVALLVSLSSRRIGRTHVWVDVGACALFGGFTVLSTKAFSSLLTKEWVAVFKEWITYPVLAVLIGTGVGQIRYLNRALMKFDSKVVIPAQFVFFNISAIVGSAVLYGDFRKASLHQMVTFLYGCGATFAGVFMLTWGTAERRENARAEEASRAERTGHGHVQVMVLPHSPPRPTPLLRAKTSSLTLSPAQRALLVRTLSDEQEELDG